MEKKIGFVGAGKMATAIIKGLLGTELFAISDIMASEPNVPFAKSVSADLGIKVVSDNKQLVKECDIVLFAVKPFVLKEVLEEVSDYVDETKLLISIAAGIPTKRIEELLGKKARLIKVMPNTPALVGCGASAVCKGENATYEDFQTVIKIFKSVGRVVELQEKDIDAVTGVSGSGPAFYYYIINEIAKAGEALGLDYKTSLQLSAQTALGAAKMILDTGVSPEQLINNVTTPSGTTAEGNKVLLESNMSEILFETVKKTAEKSELMSKQL